MKLVHLLLLALLITIPALGSPPESDLSHEATTIERVAAIEVQHANQTSTAKTGGDFSLLGAIWAPTYVARGTWATIDATSTATYYTVRFVYTFSPSRGVRLTGRGLKGLITGIPKLLF